MFVINELNIKKKWKYDGYQYLLRKNCKGIREDVEKLKIGGINVIILVNLSNLYVIIVI